MPTTRTIAAMLPGAWLALLAACGHAAIVEDHTPDNVAELKAEVAKIAAEGHIPAVGVALIVDGRTEWLGALGVSDVATGRSADAGTLFRIGSISKGFVALAALQLQEQGKLTLDDTLRQWAPEIALPNRWEATHPVRLVDLMEHTAGLDDMNLREYANQDAPMPLRTALSLYPDTHAARWAPGSRYAYSNTGPAMMAYVIEKASGQRFEDYVRQHLFAPIGMTTATYFQPDDARFAGQYGADGRTRLPYWNILFRPAGAINASPRDMAHYLAFLLARGRAGETRVLPPASIERMERCTQLPMCRQGVQAAYGLGSASLIESGLRFQGHDGAVAGALAFLAYLPAHGAGFAVMVNSGNGMAADRIRKLMLRYLARRYSAPTPAPGIAPDPVDAARYAGYYRGVSPRNEALRGLMSLVDLIVVSFDGKGMTTRFVLNRSHDDWVLLPGHVLRKLKDPVPTAALYLDANGVPTAQSFTGTYVKVSAFGAIAPLALAIGSLVLMLSSPLFALVWGVRKAFGRLAAAGPLRVRVLPLLASSAFIAHVLAWALAGAGRDPLPLLGKPTAWSVTILASGIAFALLAVVAAVVVWRERKAAMNRGAWWHSALVAGAVVLVAAYLLACGLIGVPTWLL